MSLDIEIDDRVIRQEREKSRALRKQNWWKNRIAKGVCHYCGHPVAPKDLTLDHIVPLARGGRTTKGNCVPACKDCNNQKKNLLPLEWEGYLQHLQEQ
ncbi:MAG: HNH endonuclease [Desulfuromusa sp.]|jgi:5-methylcytosine-specific restriction protein A|nr:HNH endonuclease [Desulfuromusa sp.]